MWKKIEPIFKADFWSSQALISLTIVMVTLLLAYIFRKLFGRFIQKSTKIIQNDPTNYLFLKHAISAIIYIVGFSLAFYEIEYFRTIANSLLAGAGILAIAVGFASQHALSNIISGIFLIIFKPYRINDRIIVREKLSGIVQDITLRHTVIKDFQNRRIVIPNSVISEEVVINADLEDERVCRFIEVTIRYEENLDLAKKIIQEAAQRHPFNIDVRTEEEIELGEPVVVVRVIELGELGVKLRGYAWAKNQPDGFKMHCDLLETIKKEFEDKGIKIPYPYRTLVTAFGGETSPPLLH
jgi:small conductance mechanosensitive channel